MKSLLKQKTLIELVGVTSHALLGFLGFRMFLSCFIAVHVVLEKVFGCSGWCMFLGV